MAPAMLQALRIGETRGKLSVTNAEPSMCTVPDLGDGIGLGFEIWYSLIDVLEIVAQLLKTENSVARLHAARNMVNRGDQNQAWFR